VKYCNVWSTRRVQKIRHGLSGSDTSFITGLRQVQDSCRLPKKRPKRRLRAKVPQHRNPPGRKIRQRNTDTSKYIFKNFFEVNIF
jgi:hypothetical protein